LNYGGRHFSNE
jgi:predicted metalloendopeptidase